MRDEKEKQKGIIDPKKIKDDDDDIIIFPDDEDDPDNNIIKIPAGPNDISPLNSDDDSDKKN